MFRDIFIFRDFFIFRDIFIFRYFFIFRDFYIQRLFYVQIHFYIQRRFLFAEERIKGKNSRSHMVFKKGILKSFAISTGKQVCCSQSLFNKVRVP